MTVSPIKTLSPHLIDAARAALDAERQCIRAQTGDRAERFHHITCARVALLAALAHLASEEAALTARDAP